MVIWVMGLVQKHQIVILERARSYSKENNSFELDFKGWVGTILGTQGGGAYIPDRRDWWFRPEEV